MKYRKRPVVIEAQRVTAFNVGELAAWCDGRVMHTKAGPRVAILTLEGQMTGEPGDWIIKGVESEFYPCKDSIFQATYEPAGEAHQ